MPRSETRLGQCPELTPRLGKLEPLRGRAAEHGRSLKRQSAEVSTPKLPSEQQLCSRHLIRLPGLQKPVQPRRLFCPLPAPPLRRRGAETAPGPPRVADQAKAELLRRSKREKSNGKALTDSTLPIWSARAREPGRRLLALRRVVALVERLPQTPQTPKGWLLPPNPLIRGRKHVPSEPCAACCQESRSKTWNLDYLWS